VVKPKGSRSIRELQAKRKAGRDTLFALNTNKLDSTACPGWQGSWRRSSKQLPRHLPTLSSVLHRP
jgi:hypothetical protein